MFNRHTSSNSLHSLHFSTPPLHIHPSSLVMAISVHFSLKMVVYSKINYCGKCKACVDAGDDGVDIRIPLPLGNYCVIPVVTWHCKAVNRVYVLKCSVCAHDHLIVLYVGETGATLMDRTRWNRKPNNTTSTDTSWTSIPTCYSLTTPSSISSKCSLCLKIGILKFLHP